MMDPPMEMMEEEEPMMMMEEKMESVKSSVKSVPAPVPAPEMKEEEDSEFPEPRPLDDLSTCCCCLCACSNEKTKEQTCLGCFPIKCGVVSIGIVTLTLAIWLITYNFFELLNDYFAWYYPVIMLAAYLPLFIACSLFVVFFTQDKYSTRSRLMYACILVIVSLILACTWTLIYIWEFYKNDTIYEGINDPAENHYVRYSKKYYMFKELAITIVLCIVFAYFITVCNRYNDLMYPEALAEKDEKKKMEADEKKKQEELEKMAKM